jgi:uncharacterized phage protein (TIGR02218 family)
MRSIEPALQAHLNGGATTLCRAWILRRADGAVFGFTDHDAPLVVDGVTCEAVSGFESGAIESSTGLSVDNAMVRGALTSDRIKAADIALGKWDGAAVTLWWVNWQEPGQNLRVFAGSLGEIRQGPLAFEAELRGLSAKLNLPLGRAYLRRCDAVLGDSRCGVALAALTVDSVVIEAAPGELVLAAAGETGRFTGGTLVFADGRRATIKQDRGPSEARILTLWQELPMAAGESVKLTPGCGKTSEICRTKFQNLNNFRGFPDLPGEDWIMAVPYKGRKLDGGSLRDGQ